MIKREFKIIVKVIREGQPRPYADSEYEYEIEAENYGEYGVKDFCIRFLCPCKQTKKDWDIRDANSYFHGYYEFSKISENKYRYFCRRPYTG